jgi:hypothetical protein
MTNNFVQNYLSCSITPRALAQTMRAELLKQENL